jgi:hypothetical protein
MVVLFMINSTIRNETIRMTAGMGTPLCPPIRPPPIRLYQSGNWLLE